MITARPNDQNPSLWLQKQHQQRWSSDGEKKVFPEKGRNVRIQLHKKTWNLKNPFQQTRGSYTNSIVGDLDRDTFMCVPMHCAQFQVAA